MARGYNPGNVFYVVEPGSCTGLLDHGQGLHACEYTSAVHAAVHASDMVCKL